MAFSRIIILLIDTTGSVLLMTQYMIKMILMNISNFLSAIFQIISFLPYCCVFVLTSKTNCFGIGSGICQRTNCNAICSFIFLPFLVWICFFGGLGTSLKFLGYSKIIKKTNSTNNTTDITLHFTNSNNTSNDDNTVSGSDPTDPTAIRVIRFMGSKTIAPKTVYFHALPPEIIKPYLLTQDYKKILHKFKRKASEPLAVTVTPAPVDKVNTLAFKHNLTTLQPMPEILQTPKRNQTFIRDIFRRYWHRGKW